MVHRAETKKRKGPLPLWLAEFLLIGLYAGIVLAATRYYTVSRAALGRVGSLVGSVYEQVEKLLPKKA